MSSTTRSLLLKKKLEQAIGKCMLTEDLSTKSEHNFTDIFIKSSFHMESE